MGLFFFAKLGEQFFPGFEEAGFLGPVFGFDGRRKDAGNVFVQGNTLAHGHRFNGLAELSGDPRVQLHFWLLHPEIMAISRGYVLRLANKYLLASVRRKWQNG